MPAYLILMREEPFQNAGAMSKYQAALPFRKNAASHRAILVEGL